MAQQQNATDCALYWLFVTYFVAFSLVMDITSFIAPKNNHSVCPNPVVFHQASFLIIHEHYFHKVANITRQKALWQKLLAAMFARGGGMGTMGKRSKMGFSSSWVWPTLQILCTASLHFLHVSSVFNIIHNSPAFLSQVLALFGCGRPCSNNHGMPPWA